MFCKKELLELIKDVVILYVEDEDSIREEVTGILKFFCNNVLTSVDGEEAYEIYKKEKPHIILTDIKMPNMDGIALAKKIREDDLTTAIIFLTAHTDEKNLLLAANLNIQAYIPKAILTYEKITNTLFQAIKFLNLTTNLYIHITDELLYDKTTGTIIYQDKLKISLNKKEKTFIDLLTENKNKIVTYQEIENYVWDGYYEVMTGTALRTMVKNLRKKIPVIFIENVSKQGYKLTIK